MKYTTIVDNITNSVAHVLVQAAQACLEHLVHIKQIPEPTSQDEVDKLGKQIVAQLSIAAVAKATFNPQGVLYNEELVPFMELITKQAEAELPVLINESVERIIEDRPEGTPPPPTETKPENEDPIVKAQQGRSKIIIPGVND